MPLNLLVIGGSRFVGRHLVEAALQAGHAVTLFNRGQSSPWRPEGAQVLIGDRQGDLSALAEPGLGPWDAVIDCCAYLPADAARMADALAGRVGRYVLISSVSVYASSQQPNDEAAPLGTLDDADTTVVDGRTYGPLKALCEAAVVARLGAAQALIVRPGLVVGPLDPTQRFTWWPARLARAAQDRQPVLAPGRPARGLQYIDARDLATWVLGAVACGASGAFNLVVPPGFTTMGGLLQACATAAGADPALLRWVAEADLLAHGVAPWVGLPLWLPEGGEHAAFMAVPQHKAAALGLQPRPLAHTVADTLAWWQGLPPAQQAFTLAGLPAEREAALLAMLPLG